MKRLFVILFLLNLSVANGQIGVEGGVYGEYFHGYPPYNLKNSLFSGGAVAYIQLGKFVTLDYRFGMSRSGSIEYIHCPASWGLAGFIRQNHGSPLGVLLCIIPEGIGFYTRKDHSGLHVGIDALGLDYYHIRNNWSDVSNIRGSLLFRYRFSKEFKLHMVSPYAGICATSFRQGQFEFNLGIAITFESEKREKKVSNDEDETIREKTKNRLFHRN